MPPRHRSARLAAATAVLGAVTALAAPPAAFAADTPAPGAVPLRVVSYNIHAGAGSDNVFDLDRQTEALRATDADVIGLQEVDVHWGQRSEWRDLAAELGQRLGMYVHFAPIYRLAPPAEGAPPREYGVAVLSRYRIVSAENHQITRLSTQDPNPVPAPAPGFAEAVLRVRGLPVHVYVTHLDFRGDPSVRQAQVADTRRILAEDCDGRGRCPSQLLLGDFNAEPDAPELAPLWRELRDAGPDGPNGATFPAEVPEKRIDFVTTSRDSVRVRAVSVPATLASDHRPVLADLELKRPR
ncbi:endonuclease/exonuclease/phosphatase family protein [Streptomyces sp. NPDC058045]|uniref:endonuclease/exonuclease/phosphatase family protein n=1 Tax=Streptomyces sp. NPDC058045 TaxID=3346311 RepID=UPI0036ED1A5F